MNTNDHNETLKLLVNLFHGIDSERISKEERERLKLIDDAYIYGEIDFISFTSILERVEPQAHEIFYDLGCGAGKAIFTAALNYDFSKVTGIEYIPGLINLAKAQTQKAQDMINTDYLDFAQIFSKRLATIEFIEADFLKQDFTDADIIFVNATCLSFITWEKIQEKLLKLKPGCRVIITTKKLHEPYFESLYQGLELMSWGMGSVNIYKKMI